MLVEVAIEVLEEMITLCKYQSGLNDKHAPFFPVWYLWLLLELAASCYVSFVTTFARLIQNQIRYTILTWMFLDLERWFVGTCTLNRYQSHTGKTRQNGIRTSFALGCEL